MAVTGINAIETSFVNDYGTNLQLLSQQKLSRLRDTVTVQSFTGEGAAFIEQVGKAGSQKRTTRHGDTPLNPIPMDRRWVYPVDYDTADLIDNVDKLRMIIDPKSAFARAQASALARDMDDEIIEGILVANNTGKSGGTSTSFDSNNAVAVGGTGLTIDKLRTIRELMEDNDVDFEMEPVCAIITPKQRTQLLETTEITSTDYNTVKALVNGDVDTFMGFKFIVSNRLLGASKYNGSQTITSNNERALFYPKSGVGLGIWQEVSAQIDVRPDKRYSWQVYASMTCGATRLEEAKVYSADTLTTA